MTNWNLVVLTQGRTAGRSLSTYSLWDSASSVYQEVGSHLHLSDIPRTRKAFEIHHYKYTNYHETNPLTPLADAHSFHNPIYNTSTSITIPIWIVGAGHL